MGAQSLTIRPGAIDDAALAAYAAGLKSKRADTAAGLADVAEQLRGSEFFDLFLDGRLVGRYALRVTRWARGTEVEITGAVGGARGLNLTDTVLPIIESLQLAGADCIKVETRRKALIGRLIRQGFEVCSVNLRKRVKK